MRPSFCMATEVKVPGWVSGGYRTGYWDLLLSFAGADTAVNPCDRARL
jgi:hypothetical protein